METTISKEYQKLIDKLNIAIEHCEDSEDKEIPLSVLEEVRDGIKNLGMRPVLSSNVQQFMDITTDMAKTYAAKNHDYGNSFSESLNEFGLVAAVVRIGDKMNRIKSLIKKEAEVKDESIQDTLLDMANYCIMTVMWMNKTKEE